MSDPTKAEISRVMAKLGEKGGAAGTPETNARKGFGSISKKRRIEIAAMGVAARKKIRKKPAK